MSLGPDFEPERASVSFGKGEKRKEISLRGFGVEDLTGLISTRLNEVEELYSVFASAKASIYSRSSLDGFILTMIQKAPDLVAEVISRAADEFENVSSYRKLPFGVSAAALVEITRLTFEEAGGLKNLLATLIGLINEALPEATRAMIESRAAANVSAPSLQ